MTSDDIPVTVEQIGAALAALGVYEGNNTPVEHVERAAQFASPDVYRLRLLNTLLGAVQGQAKLADEAEEDGEDLFTAWLEQLNGAGAGDDPVRQISFLGWQVRRVGIPLFLLANDPDTGAIVDAAAKAAEALHIMLGVIGTLEEADPAVDFVNIINQGGMLRAGRELLVTALDNTDTALDTFK
ncbi:hypothetical protein PUR61_34910 [Streptomyces sp. BE20]|uniref:DUF6245 family protein n=1 Tax=Streptomyces sp. BE20 TaxID=3002525 RepID=UPI002E778F43|nr:DUF6245 family protein [Streptomyces sp. BE20]MEE1827345.1 hypothetical protein [Streptomyces sp. BE20]